MKIHGVAVLLAAVCGTAFAQSAGGDFAVKRSRIAGGGGESSGGDVIVTGTAGQHDAGEAMQGGDLRVLGGVWPERGVPLPAALFGDGFEGPP